MPVSGSVGLCPSLRAWGPLAGCVSARVRDRGDVLEHKGCPELAVGICIFIMGCFMTGYWSCGGVAQGLGCSSPEACASNTDASLLPAACQWLTDSWRQEGGLGREALLAWRGRAQGQDLLGAWPEQLSVAWVLQGRGNRGHKGGWEAGGQ